MNFPKDKNLILDTTFFTNTVDQIYKPKTYRQRAGFLHQNFLSKVLHSFPDNYKKILVGYYSLLGAIIKQAIWDAVDLDEKKTHVYPGEQRFIKNDAIKFLFGKRLTRFIDFWELPLNAGMIRKQVVKKLRKKYEIEIRIEKKS